MSGRCEGKGEGRPRARGARRPAVPGDERLFDRTCNFLLHPRVRAAGRATKGRAARRGFTSRCREPTDTIGDDHCAVNGMILARIWDDIGEDLG